MAGDRRDKRILTTEELERQRKEEEDQHFENLRRRVEEEDKIPEEVYRHHIRENPIDDVVLPQNIPGNIPGTNINIYDRDSIDPSHFFMFLDKDGNPRVVPDQEGQSGQPQEEEYHRLGEDQEGDQHVDNEEKLVIPQPRIKLRRGRREKSGSGQRVRVRSKYF